MKNNIPVRCCTLVLILVAIVACGFNNQLFDEILDYYGFSQPNQKIAFKNLLNKAEIASTWNANSDAENILYLVQATQEKFVKRIGKQDRWEAESLEWIKRRPKEIISDLRCIGFVDAIKPQLKSVDAICIFGSSGKVMENEIRFAESLLAAGLETKAVVLLTGERYVTAGLDGNQKQLSALSHKLGIADWKQLRETHIFYELYKSSALSKRNLKLYVIDTQRGSLQRPTTQTTLMDFIKFLQQHNEIKHILFVSNQPYVKYQNEIVKSVFNDCKTNIEFEVVGDGVPAEYLRYIIDGLGSYIYAKSPVVIQQIKPKINEETKASFDMIYSKLPLFNKMICGQ